MDKVQEIRKALQTATPGPWEIEGREIWRRGEDYISDHDPHIWVADVRREENRTLIANAPEWLSYLLSELDETQEHSNDWRDETMLRREQIESLQQQLDESKHIAVDEILILQHENRKIRKELDAAKQENESYRESLEEWKADFASLKQENERLREVNAQWALNELFQEEAGKEHEGNAE